MHWTETEPRLTVYPSFVLFVCILLWLEQGHFALIFLCSAALHECAHLLALRLTGVAVYGMELRASGAVLHTGSASYGKEAVCTAAGPFANLLLLAVCFHRFPAAAPVNLLLLCYNLLPIYPLDGGRLLRILLCVLFGAQRGERLSERITVILTGLIAVCGIAATCVLHMGLYPCLIAAFFLCRIANTPCKMRKIRLK